MCPTFASSRSLLLSGNPVQRMPVTTMDVSAQAFTTFPTNLPSPIAAGTANHWQPCWPNVSPIRLERAQWLQLSQVSSTSNQPCNLISEIILQPHPPPPHIHGKYMNKHIWPQNCQVCLVLKHFGSYFVLIFVHIFAVYMGGGGHSRVSDYFSSLKHKQPSRFLKRALAQTCLLVLYQVRFRPINSAPLVRYLCTT